MPRALSTRSQTRLTGIYTRAGSGNRSLARGLDILRAFRSGTGWLGNAEIAERTGLPRSTVSRLARTLVEAGFLAFDPERGTYCLGRSCLSLGYGAKRGADVLRLLRPLMRELAEGQRLNVGLAVPDGREMVYLDSIRRDHGRHFDHVETGYRLPMELSSLGRAHLSTLADDARDALLEHLGERHGERWPSIRDEVEEAVRAVQSQGWCAVAWDWGIVAVAAPICPGHIVNVTRTTGRVGRGAALETCSKLIKRLLTRAAANEELRLEAPYV